jgi:hypothetical protein
MRAIEAQARPATASHTAETEPGDAGPLLIALWDQLPGIPRQQDADTDSRQGAAWS